MKRKIVYIITLFTVLISFGCASGQDKNENSVNADIQTEMQTEVEDVREDTKPYDTAFRNENTDNADVSVSGDVNAEDEYVQELYEGDIMEYIDTITDDMLDACREYPSYNDYFFDPIVFLYEYNEDLRLYGINTKESSAMLLYVQGEKILVYYGYQNHYAEPPKLDYSDIDSDGVEEIVISFRTASGNISSFGLIVCDYEDTWNVYPYDDYLKDIEKIIQWQYDEENNAVIFMDMEGNVLTEQVLPEWTDSHSSHLFTGTVNYEDQMSFDAETMLFCVDPLIGLERSLPYRPIQIVFNVIYKDGEFDLDYYYIQDTYWNQNAGK